MRSHTALLGSIALGSLALTVLPAGQARAAGGTTTEVVSLLESLSDEQHPCLPVIKELDARLAAAPEDVAAHLGRAECRYRVGDLDGALADSTAVFGEAKASKVEKALARDLGGDPARTLTHDGLVQHAVLLSLRDRTAEAATAHADLEKTYGETAGLLRARAVQLWTSGDRDLGWRLVDKGLDAHPEDPHSKAAAMELASLDPDRVSEKAMTLISAPARSNRAFNRAISALNAGQWSTCIAEVDSVLAEQRGPSVRRFQLTAYTCAAMAGDLDRAGELAAALGEIPPERADAALAHAEKLHDAGRMDEAAAILAATTPQDAEQRGIRATLLVRIHTKAGRLDEALAAASEGEVRGPTLANLALALKKADRNEEARAVLAPACEQMSGQDAARCVDLLKRLGG